MKLTTRSSQHYNSSNAEHWQSSVSIKLELNLGKITLRLYLTYFLFFSVLASPSKCLFPLLKCANLICEWQYDVDGRLVWWEHLLMSLFPSLLHFQLYFKETNDNDPTRGFLCFSPFMDRFVKSPKQLYSLNTIC
jgi:hypothetical protein